MAKASVFLSNSSYGTITNDDGTFTLSGLKPGQYELVVTSVGFKDFNKTIMVPRDAKEPVRLDVEMIVKTTQLHEVVITTPENWKRNYDQFVKLFLGESANAKKCKILNPHSLSFINHKARQGLEAWSDEFVEIENKALGYKVKFLLKSFNYDGIDNIISWEGKILFNDLPGSASQKKQWEEKRNDIYYGSNMHFFRSLQGARLSEDGFAVMLLQRKPNPNRPPQEMLMKKITFWGDKNIDSANKYRRLYNLPKYDENLIRQPLKETDIARATEQPGVFMIGFPEHLYVMYTKKREEEYMADIYRPLDMPNYQVSILTLHTQYAMFDMNGTIISTPPPLFEGTWSKSKAPELLPVDYVPGELVLKEKL